MKKVRTIGKYDVIRVLGVGGMGTVYQCIDPDLQRFVAVKVLNIRKNKDTMNALRLRFLREALTTAQLQHPSIPPVYEVGRDPDGQVYYVMKPIEGQPLQNILQKLKDDDPQTREEFDLFRLISILRDVCQAIQYAHTRGHIHRDLKPSNIFVGNYGEVYVIDWGLTKVIKETLKDECPNKFEKLKELFDLDQNIDCDKIDLTQTLLLDDVVRTGEFGLEGLPETQLLEDLLPTREIKIDEQTRTLLLDEAKRLKKTDVNSISIENIEKTLVLDEIVPANRASIEMSQTLTLQGKVLGTLSYMPPEQALGKIEMLGREVDIYSLGVILYEILTLELPISDTDFKTVIAQKVKGLIEAPEFRTTEREIPPELSAAAMQAMNPLPDDRFKSVKDFMNALEFWIEGKSQFRQVNKSNYDPEDFFTFPHTSKKTWLIQKDSITTQPLPADGNNYLLLKKELIGDVVFSANVIAYPLEEDGDRISEIVLILNATLPDNWDDFLDCYSIHIAANQNTRAFIAKHEVEVISNEYVMIEPRKRYLLVVERKGSSIKVSLNNQIILFYQENYPFTGMFFGFQNKGANILISDIKLKVQGMPSNVSAINVPEALMEEKCYEGAMKRFLAIAQGHKNRHLGAWACYRAGIASYLMNRSLKDALRIWLPLRKGPYALFEKLGKASLELENGRHLGAIGIINSMLSDNAPVPHLESVADIVFTQAQQWLRQKQKGEKEWKIIDGWVRLSLKFGQRLEKKESITPSILWRWMLLALTEYPKHLSDCILFLRKTFGKGQGAFAEILTTIDPLMTILKRSAAMSGHAFLVDKVMRLILHHDDNLGNLETLVRFYINSGHVDVAERISCHINALCKKHECIIPPVPISFTACLSWIRGNENARGLIELMINKSTEWAVPDGRLLLGLDYYKNREFQEARSCWREIINDNNAISFNRHLVAKGLLGELSPDPLEAGVPNRSDHRVLYCLFVGYRYFLDWKQTRNVHQQDMAVKLLKTALEIMRPSYDIYSATELFYLIPLEELGYYTEALKKPEPLTKEEDEWLEKLTVAASEMKPSGHHKFSSVHKYSSYRTNSKILSANEE